MDAGKESDLSKNRTAVDRESERELVVTRSFNGPARIVFEAWANPALFAQWWVPKSSGVSLLSCDMDIRTGGTYRLEFGHPSADRPLAFFGKYIEVTPPSRLVWTNEESADGAVTTVTFEEKDGRTLVVLRDLYPSKKALDDAVASGSTSGFDEQFAQLDALLAAQA
jgi:uncharacterized protein YndB with AHSA1/START domain